MILISDIPINPHQFVSVIQKIFSDLAQNGSFLHTKMSSDLVIVIVYFFFSQTFVQKWKQLQFLPLLHIHWSLRGL